jgi:hypothetical protein
MYCFITCKAFLLFSKEKWECVEDGLENMENMEKVDKWASGHLDDLKLFFRVEEDMRMNIYTIIIYNYMYYNI